MQEEGRRESIREERAEMRSSQIGDVLGLREGTGAKLHQTEAHKPDVTAPVATALTVRMALFFMEATVARSAMQAWGQGGLGSVEVCSRRRTGPR